MTFAQVNDSTFLQFTGYGIADQTQTVEAAYGISDAHPFNGNIEYGINVALVLPRANDPTSMLAGDWASRQAALQALNDTNSLWTTYGADQTQFNNAVTYLTQTLGLSVLDSTNSNYITSAESRTIWVAINTQADFQNLFGTELEYSSSAGIWFWNGSLSLPTELTVAGLWFDTSTVPNASNMAPGVSVTLPAGPQSIGNNGDEPEVNPQAVASLYNYPLDGAAYQTGTIGLIEPGVATYLSSSDPTGIEFQARLEQYLANVQTSGNGTVYVQGVNGQYEISGGERSLDVGIAAAVNPNSNLALYNGSGGTDATGNAQSSVFTAIQSSIWGTASNSPANTQTVATPPVTTNSWGDSQYMAPGSPFYEAYSQLFVDAALHNQTTVIALGDGGSGNQTANGLPNVETNVTSSYNLLVGGSSLSRVHEASTDSTLNAGANSLYQLALAGDPATIWTLVSGGLSTMPNVANPDDWLVETVWNQYAVTDHNTFVGGNANGDSYTQNNSGSGGVDTTQPTPVYQVDFGLTSAANGGLALTGRGAPDVVAPAGGNLFYTTPGDDMTGLTGEGGTSAASPFWAGLITQINYVFNDQGLPNLGYMTDLLYLAAAVAPGSFNDISMGNNTSSYTMGGSNYGGINPTGYGYEAGAGYDLTSGLGSPNGLVLARTLTEIAHAQTSSTAPAVMNIVDDDTGTSTVAQTLLVQSNYHSAADVLVQVDGTAAVEMDGNSTYGWTSQLAGQVVQGNNFDSALVTLFDGGAKSVPYEISVQAGATLDVSADGQALALYQQLLTNDYGFIQFGDVQGGITLARPVAIAQTAGGADDQDAVVRIRQNGGDDARLEIYKVDDLNGTINGVAPGQVGYEAAAAARDYQLVGGGTVIDGPGWGNYTQVEIAGVDQGDFVALKYTNVTTNDIYWAFSQGNSGNVTSIYNYGLNTWGFEDRPLTGDHDFQDLVVQLDFTSTAGHGLLVT